MRTRGEDEKRNKSGRGKELKRTRTIKMKTKRNGARCIERKGDCDERKSIEVKKKNCTERSRNRRLSKQETKNSEVKAEKKIEPEKKVK